MGSRVRVCLSISWCSGSAAIASTKSTIDESWVSVQMNGISVRSNGGMALTSTARRPVSGIRFATPSAGSSVLSGSTSITISSPGWITRPTISAFADLERLPSSTSVGIGADLPGMSCTCVSAPVYVEPDPDQRNPFACGLPGGREHPQQSLLARDQRNREFPRLDRLGEVGDRRFSCRALRDPPLVDTLQPSLKVQIRWCAEASASGRERLQGM